MHIVMVGNTGSGKTTLGNELARRLDLPVISSGDVARKLSERDPATRLALQQGAMAPEQAMRSEIRARIEAAEARRGGWVLDGFPRTIEQLICLHQWSAAMPTYLLINLSAWECVQRLTDRGREHDNPDAIARRLAFFDKGTRDMLQVLSGSGALVALDGACPQEDLARYAMREIA